MDKNQTTHTFMADDNATFLDKWDKIFLFSSICIIATIVGEVMIIYYIVKYAPKERPINKLVLIDQVCTTQNHSKEFCSTCTNSGLKF